MPPLLWNTFSNLYKAREREREREIERRERELLREEESRCNYDGCARVKFVAREPHFGPRSDSGSEGKGFKNIAMAAAVTAAAPQFGQKTTFSRSARETKEIAPFWRVSAGNATGRAGNKNGTDSEPAASLKHTLKWDRLRTFARPSSASSEHTFQ